MSREVKIGLFAIIALTIAYLGYNFLKGKDLFSSNNLFYVEYKNVDQLQNGAPVLVNGLAVGGVKNVYLKPENYSLIVVEIEVRGDLNVPKGSTAEIVPTGLMGGKGIQLLFNGTCTSGNCAVSGDHLNGGVKGMLDSYLGIEKVQEYTGVLQNGLTKMIDSLSYELKKEDNEVGNSMRDLQATLQNLNALTGQLNSMLAGSKKDIAMTMSNMAAISENLKQQNSQINTIMANTASFTGQLSSMDLAKTTNGANQAMASLETTLKSADQAMKDLSGLMNKVNSGTGTMSLMMNNPDLYNKLISTSENLDYLLQDFRLNPKRYTRILKRKQIPYVKPENDPAHN